MPAPTPCLTVFLCVSFPSSYSPHYTIAVIFQVLSFLFLYIDLLAEIAPALPQEIPEQILQPLRIPNMTFPNNKVVPACRRNLSQISRIPIAVPLQLWKPVAEIRVREPRQPAAVAVPEAAMNENNFASRHKYEVRGSW